ncbi:hypothetical protein HYU22_02910 [Candidatus Woesearchaeota archaeon]|nr:hypothetical protein [Candidatus Woesearchaeota archaeon]
MHHTLRSIIVILVLVGVVVALGVVVGTGGITGGTVADTIACYNNDDCDDKIAATEDICKNPGTISSLCVNRPIR